MLRLTTMVTAAALLASLPASASPANLVLEQHYSESGYQVDLYATQDSDGVLTEVTLTEPDTVERVDLWTDGETIYWSGTVDGELAEGSVPVREIDSDPHESPICATPVTAVICIGVVILSALGSGCATNSNACPVTESEYPDGGNPGPSGEGGGDGKGGEGSGGDED